MKIITTSRFKRFLLGTFDIVSFFILALGILLCIRFFIVNPFTVVGSSMETTYSDGDFIFVDKITSHFGSYTRGDVIVFIPQGQEKPFIKRIIGLPGETVKIHSGSVSVCKDNQCSILNEPYLAEGVKTLTTCDKQEFQVKNGFFVLGDNRGGSTDSRCCFNPLGCVENETYETTNSNIIGKVFIRMFPNFGFVK